MRSGPSDGATGQLEVINADEGAIVINTARGDLIRDEGISSLL
jgi:phosphoglycerate dehydrogenase-like enzyme